MDAEAYNKSYGGGKWWVDQCGWGRPFRTEEAADAYIALMETLTVERVSARVSPLKLFRRNNGRANLRGLGVGAPERNALGDDWNAQGAPVVP